MRRCFDFESVTGQKPTERPVEFRTSFGLATEAGRLLESSGSEGQAPALLQAMLQHRFKLCTQTDHPAENRQGTDQSPVSGNMYSALIRVCATL